MGVNFLWEVYILVILPQSLIPLLILANNHIRLDVYALTLSYFTKKLLSSFFKKKPKAM